jgi:hypothetical protein
VTVVGSAITAVASVTAEGPVTTVASVDPVTTVALATTVASVGPVTMAEATTAEAAATAKSLPAQVATESLWSRPVSVI